VGEAGLGQRAAAEAMVRAIYSASES
jgi:hypothetical protein